MIEVLIVEVLEVEGYLVVTDRGLCVEIEVLLIVVDEDLVVGLEMDFEVVEGTHETGLRGDRFCNLLYIFFGLDVYGVI